MRDILWVPEPLLVSQEGLFSVKLCGLDWLQKYYIADVGKPEYSVAAQVFRRCLVNMTVRVVDKVALGQPLSEFCSFPCQLFH
jgi:hypothetical protein